MVSGNGLNNSMQSRVLVCIKLLHIFKTEENAIRYYDLNGNPVKKAGSIGISGVKDIRLHDLRHSLVSLLIHMGYSAFEIAKKEWGIKVSGVHTIMHIFFREFRKIWRRDWMRREAMASNNSIDSTSL